MVVKSDRLPQQRKCWIFLVVEELDRVAVQLTRDRLQHIYVVLGHLSVDTREPHLQHIYQEGVCQDKVDRVGLRKTHQQHRNALYNAQHYLLLLRFQENIVKKL